MTAKIDDGTLAIIKETARETAEEVIRQHRETCPIESIVHEVWGRSGETNGIKADVARNSQRLTTLESGKTWMSGLLQSILSSGMTAGAAWLLYIYARNKV